MINRSLKQPTLEKTCLRTNHICPSIMVTEDDTYTNCFHLISDIILQISM